NKSIRNVPLNRVLVARLREYLAQHPNAHDADALLWPGRKRGGAGKTRGALDWSAQFNHDNLYRKHFLPALAALHIPCAGTTSATSTPARAQAPVCLSSASPSSWATLTSPRCTSTTCTCSTT